MTQTPHPLPSVADLVALAGAKAFAVARARLHAAIAVDDLVQTEHYSAVCRDLIAGGWGRGCESWQRARRA